MESENETDARRSDRWRGLAIVGGTFLAGLCISWWASGVSSPVASPPLPPTTAGVVGFPKAVDAIGTLGAVRTLSKRTELRGISVFGAKSDGTVDVTAAGHRIRYAFTSARGEGPQPPRPPGTLPSRSFCGHQHLHVKGDGLSADPDQPLGGCYDHGAPLPDPRCGPKEVWQVAIHRGVSADRLANIEYYRASAGPAWRFKMPGGPTFSLYGDCVRELSGVDAAGSVP